MSPERWQQIQAVFHAALEREPEERNALLSELCSTDTALREEVESLLSSNDTAADFLSTPAFRAKEAADRAYQEASPDLTGSTIDHYLIVGLLGAGGMGEVYRARDQRLGREVALKILASGSPRDTGLLRRFEQEVRAVAAFNHPNICHLYDVGHWNGRPYFTMELLDGRTLREHIGGRPMPASEILRFGVQIANALDAAHAKGIVHRDIKPANIFITAGGPVKVMDFGLAKRAAVEGMLIERTYTRGGTLTGAALGTVAYMSPEQARGEELDARTDLFSFGVALYEMATGVQPFRGASTAVVFDAILNQSPVPPSRLNQELPEDLERIILTALEKDREVRFQSASEMRAALKRAERLLVSSGTAEVAPAERTVAGPYTRADDSSDGTRSLAVLPFQLLQREREGDEYLGLGLADALITKLSGMRRLVVRPTTSIYKYAGRHCDLQAAGRELDVNYAIGGLIRRSDDRVRVTVQLVNIRTGAQIWAAQLDETYTTLMSLEDSLATLAAEALIPRLKAEERELLGKRDTDNPQAYEAYLRGRYHWNAYTAEEMAQALVCFMDAIDKDPNYARAYAGVADYYNWAGAWNILPPAESFAAAKQQAMKALSLNPDLAETRTAYGYSVWNHDHDWKASEEALRGAIALNESHAAAHGFLAFLLSAQGRHGEAIAEADRAFALSPHAPGIGRCLILYYAREFDRAMAAARKAVEITGVNVTTLTCVAWIASARGDHAEAIAKAREAIAAADTGWANATLATVLAAAGEQAEARRLLAAMQRRMKMPPACQYDLALAHAALGDDDAAIACLERSEANREWWIRFVAVDWRLERLKNRRAFTALCRRVASPAARGLVPSELRGGRGLRRARFSRRALWAGPAAAALVLAALGYRSLNRPEPYFRAPQFTKITTSGNATAAAISPDGKYVAYTLDEGGRYSMWVRQVSIANGVRILPAATSMFRGLAFSRDGSYIYYVVYDVNLITQGTLYRVPTLGGAPRKVAENVSGAVSLSGDNRREAFLRSDLRTGVDELIVQDVDGGRQARIASRRYPQHFAYSSAPAWSPDGQTIAVASEATDRKGFYVSLVGVRLKDGAERVLSRRRWQYVEQMAWLPENRGILLVGRDQDSSFQQIWHVTSPDSEPRRLTNDLNDYYGLSVSADSTALVSAQVQTLTNLWRLPPSGAARRITPGYGRYFDLSLFPDGAIAYASDASGNADIWSMDANGAEERQLTSNAHRNYSPSVSPDGRAIAFHSNRSGTWNVWTMNADGGDLKQLTSDANDSNWPDWTRDGKYLVYHHIGSKGYQTIWKIPSSGGTPVQLTDHFSLRPAASPKQDVIACWYAEEAADPKWLLALLSLNGGAPLKKFAIPAGASVDSAIRWRPDGRGITYTDFEGGASNILVQSIDGGPPRRITNFSSDRIFSFDWSPAGDLVYSRGLRTTDIVLIRGSK